MGVILTCHGHYNGLTDAPQARRVFLRGWHLDAKIMIWDHFPGPMTSRTHHHWRFFLLTSCLWILLLISCTSSGGSRQIHLGGWITYWDFARGMEVINHQPTHLKDVFFFAVHLDSDGSPLLVKPDLDYGQAVALVKSKNAIPWMTVVNDVKSEEEGRIKLKDPQIIHDIFVDAHRRQVHRQQIAQLAITHGFLGVDIDYENLRSADRELFTTFIRELATELRQNKILLSITVQPKLRETLADGPGAADWGQLCQETDRVQIMLYNLHSRKTGPGPMATPSWIKAILRFAKNQCGPQQIVPVLKVSGMQWSPRGTEDIQFDQAIALAQQHHASILRDYSGEVPYFTYQIDQQKHTVYYEDAFSLQEKISVLQSLGFGSVVFWSLGSQDPALLPKLATQSMNPKGR